jgi:hypothetical protein
MAARMNPFGGICEREPLGTRTDTKGASGRRLAKRKAANR